MLDWMTDMGVEFYRQVFDKHVRLYRAINEMTDRRQMELIHKYDPAVVIPLVQGGTGARVHAALLTLSKARKGAVADGLLPEVTRYLDFKGWLRGYRILQEKADAAFQRGDLDGYQQYMQKIREGEGMPAGYTPERIQAELEEMMSSLPEADRLLVDQHAQKVWEVGRTYWDLLHETGIISDAVHQQGINRGPEYIPLHRIIDDLRNDPDWGYVGVFNAATLKSLNKLEGSARATVDPYEAMYTWATKALTDAGKNEVLSTVHGLKALDPGGLFDEAIVNLKAGQKPPHGMSKLTYRQKGRKVSFAMDSMLAASIKNASPKDVSLVHGFMQVFRRTLQVGAVSGNLAFTPRNLMRDWAEMMALSDAGSPINPVAFGRIVHRLAQSAYHILMRDESYLQFLNERAANSIMTKAIDPGYWVADVPWRKKSLWKRVKGVPMAPLRGVMEITAFSEELTKMTAWLELRKRGWSPERAAAEVRTYAGTPDFFVHGTNTEALNLAVMFFAVRQQGKLRIWRKVRKMPKKLLSLIAVSALTSLALFRHNSQYRDKDGNPEWDHVPEDVKRNYWVILSDEIDPVTGRHAQYTIRKAETLQVFYNPIERATWEVVGGQLTADDYWQAVTDFGTAAVPFFPEIDIENENALNGTLRSTVSSLNPVFKEPIEQAMNYDTYRRIPIVPRGEEDLDPRFQYSPFTSPTAIAAGKRMPPWAPEWARSPRRIEHAIRGVFAGVGEQALSIADFPAYETEVGRTIGPEDRRPFRGIEDVPVLGPVTRSAYRSRPRDKVLDDMQERFYRYYRESETIVRTLNDRYKSGDAEGAQRYIAEAPERRMLYDYNGVFRKIATTLSQLRDQRNAVVMDVETPEKDRTEEAKKIYQRQLRLLYIAEGIHENVLKVKGEMPEESKPTGPIGSPPPDLLRQLPPR
ncbi:MAG: LPD38 domain-containing protein [Planctomycetota bacterium]